MHKLKKLYRLIGFAALLAAAGAALVGAAVAAPTGSGPSHAPAPAAFVRVDQLGYAEASAKRAYLMSNVSEAGATFRLVSGGATVYSAPVRSALTPWSGRFQYEYALDFDSASAPGSYVIEVTGPAAAASPPFRIDTPANLYATPLHNTLSFYEDERDGPDFIRSPLRTAPGHLNDRDAQTYLTPHVDPNGAFKGDLTPLHRRIDASGGWWDAGDYLKFVQTTSYTVSLMLTGVRDFPAQMGAAAGASNFTSEAQFGLDWLLRMWDDRTRTLYYQVGIGSGNNHTVSDHDIWRLPQVDDTYGGDNPLYRYIRHRPVFRAAPAGSLVSPNLAGRDAAAFGLCFQVFHTTDPAMAAQCLRSGEDIFALANTDPHRLLTAIPYGFYPETEWRDDLELGAVELANALAAGAPPKGLAHPTPQYYLSQAARWARAYIGHSGSTGDTLNLYDVSGLAHYELYRALGRPGTPAALAQLRPELLANLQAELARAQSIGARDPFGFGFPWGVYDTTSHGFGLSVMASEVASLTGDPNYRTLAVRWLGNVLGANPWGVSLVVGDGTTFPDCIQHQVANIVGSLHGGSPVLAGAVVEGPNGAATTGLLPGMRLCPASGADTYALFNSGRKFHSAVFRDNMQSYSTTEPAIDLTASSPLAFSWQVAMPQPPPGA